MAEITSHTPTSKPARGKYPWSIWLDGKQRLLRKGVDFDGNTHYMRMYVYAAASRLGKKVAIECDLDAGTLLVQAITEGD